MPKETNYNILIDKTPGRSAGNSRKAGAAPYEVKVKAVEAIRKYAGLYGFNEHQTSEVLKIVEHESGFNPDAANPDTTASGLGQMMNDTFEQYGPRGANIFDLDANAEATVRYYQHCLNKAAEKGLTGEKLDTGAYACYHDGPWNFKAGKDKKGADIYKKVIKKLSGKPKVSSNERSSSNSDKVAEATERDSERTAAAEQPDDAYSTEDRKRKDLAGDDAESETAWRGGNSDRRSIPNSWIADAGNVLSDVSGNALQSALREARKPTDVESAANTMTLREAPTDLLAEPGSPLQHVMDALGVSSGDVHLTPAEADDENETPDSFDIVDKGTSEKIGSCLTTPGGCEMTAGDRKVVMDRISGNDIHLQTYAKNDDGDFELVGTTRIGDNDGVTARRPFAG